MTEGWAFGCWFATGAVGLWVLGWIWCAYGGLLLQCRRGSLCIRDSKRYIAERLLAIWGGGVTQGRSSDPHGIRDNCPWGGDDVVNRFVLVLVGDGGSGPIRTRSGSGTVDETREKAVSRVFRLPGTRVWCSSALTGTRTIIPASFDWPTCLTGSPP